MKTDKQCSSCGVSYEWFLLAPSPPLGCVMGWLNHQPYAACWGAALPQQ